MFSSILYLASIFFLLIILILTTVYFISLFYSSYMGALYVPSRKKEIEYILQQAHLKKGKVFLDAGCGDGRVVHTAVKKYGVKGIGVDINPVLIFIARFFSFVYKIPSQLTVENLINTNYSSADYIYFFLLPELLKKLLPVLLKQVKKNVIIISHGFPLKHTKLLLYKKISHKPFPTYFYRVIQLS